eukprot:729867_1
MAEAAKAILDDGELIRLLSNDECQAIPELKVKEITVHVSVQLIYQQLIDVVRNPLSVSCKWRKNKQETARIIFEQINCQEPNQYIPVAHTNRDDTGQTSGKCMLFHRCKARKYGCATRSRLWFLIKDLFCGAKNVTVHCEFEAYTCYNSHAQYVIYEDLRGTTERKKVAQETPRNAQISALMTHAYNPMSSKRNHIPSQKQAKGARHQHSHIDQYKALIKIRDKQIEKKIYESTSRKFRGDIHGLIQTKYYMSFCMWNKMDICIFQKLAPKKGVVCIIDATDKLFGQGWTSYFLKLRSPAKKDPLSLWECHSTIKDGSVFVEGLTSFNQAVKQNGGVKPRAIVCD